MNWNCHETVELALQESRERLAALLHERDTLNDVIGEVIQTIGHLARRAAQMDYTDRRERIASGEAVIKSAPAVAYVRGNGKKKKKKDKALKMREVRS